MRWIKEGEFVGVKVEGVVPSKFTMRSDSHGIEKTFELNIAGFSVNVYGNGPERHLGNTDISLRVFISFMIPAGSYREEHKISDHQPANEKPSLQASLYEYSGEAFREFREAGSKHIKLDFGTQGRRDSPLDYLWVHGYRAEFTDPPQQAIQPVSRRGWFR